MAALNLIELLKPISTPIERGFIETIIVEDELVAQLPLLDTQGQLVRQYTRTKTNPAVSWVQRGGSYSEDTTLSNEKVQAFLREVGVQVALHRADGGASYGDLKADVLARCATALSHAVGAKLITGSMAYTMTVGGDAVLAALITSVVPGPNHDLTQPIGVLRYTHGTTSWAYKAPNEEAFGAEVVVAPSNSGTIYANSPDKYVVLTRNAGGAGANGSVTLTLGGGSGEFDGILRLVTSGQTMYAGANGGNLSFELLDELIDLCKDSGQKVLGMSKRTYRSFKSLMRTAGGITMGELNGRPVPVYAGVPILQSDNIPTNRTRGLSGAVCAPVFCMTLGQGKGLCGLTTTPADPLEPGELIMRAGPFEALNLGISSTQSQRMIRTTGLFGLMNEQTKGLAMLDGVLD